jgi:hypothetical protein
LPNAAAEDANDDAPPCNPEAALATSCAVLTIDATLSAETDAVALLLTVAAALPAALLILD